MLMAAKNQMIEKGNSQQEIDMAMNITSKLMSPVGIFVSTIIMYPLFGAILCLIGAAITQKNKAIY